jgi:Arc/MetJ-type ribon-helix-helix transcriptional regulator
VYWYIVKKNLRPREHVNLDMPHPVDQQEIKIEAGKAAMEITLPAELSKRVEQELASGRYRSPDELIEQAVRQFLEEGKPGQQRLDALRRIGQAVDQAGLYEKVVIPDQECRGRHS